MKTNKQTTPTTSTPEPKKTDAPPQSAGVGEGRNLNAEGAETQRKEGGAPDEAFGKAMGMMDEFLQDCRRKLEPLLVDVAGQAALAKKIVEDLGQLLDQAKARSFVPAPRMEEVRFDAGLEAQMRGAVFELARLQASALEKLAVACGHPVECMGEAYALLKKIGEESDHQGTTTPRYAGDDASDEERLSY